MAAKSKPIVMSDYGSTTIDIVGDIVHYALRNDFKGVDRILSYDPSQINAQREDSGLTALMAASGRGLDRMVAHLLAKPDIDTMITDDFGKDALLHGRPFPQVVQQIMRHRHPNMKWQEPNIRPV